MRVAYGPDTALYGPPDGYVVVGRGRDAKGVTFQSLSVTTELIEMGGWWIVLFIFDDISTKLRQRGAVPQHWECGGWWRNEDAWSELDMDGEYKW